MLGSRHVGACRYFAIPVTLDLQAVGVVRAAAVAMIVGDQVLFHAIEAAEEAGCTVVKVVSLLDRNEGGSDEMRKRGYDFSALLAATPEGKIEPVAD